MVIARRSSLLGKITILAIVGLCANTAAALDGSGTEQDPWRIESLDDFNDFAADPNFWDDYTRLETDVNLAGLTYSTAVIAPDTDNSNYGFDGTPFTGVFDGNDHKIINLTIDDGGAGNDYRGLFGYIDDGEVKNLALEGSSVRGEDYVGCLVGRANGSISSCYSNGDVNGVYSIGGLVGGKMYSSSMTNCYSTSDVSGVYYIGGLVGNNSGPITNCYANGSVRGSERVGGLVGSNDLSGYIISNCYSNGDVTGDLYIGGLVGYNGEMGAAIYITDCYSTVDVNGLSMVGALIGINSCDIYHSFWDTDIQTHGVTESIGYNQGGWAVHVYGLPTSEMQKKSTFTETYWARWDFINVWNIGENQTYPYLRVYLRSDINKDGIVNLLDFAITANQWLQGEENE